MTSAEVFSIYLCLYDLFMPVIHETQLFFTAFDRIAYKLPTKSIIEFQTELPVPTSFGNYYLHCLKINPLNQFIRSE